MTVFFHGNFGLRRSRLSRLAKLAVENPARTDAELGSAFGYGAPYAAVYRSWLHKIGVAKKGRPLRFTEQGAIVYEKDPKFENPVTIWFFHHELTRDPERSETWHYFMGDFRANHRRFTREDLKMGLMEKLRAHSETHFGPSSKMNPIIVRKLLECYEDSDALGPLGLIQRLDKNTFEFTDVEEPLPLDDVTTLSSSY